MTAISRSRISEKAKALREQIRRHLAREGMTHTDLAGHLGCTRANVSKLLSDGSDTKLLSLLALAEAAGLELAVVAQGEVLDGGEPALSTSRSHESATIRPNSPGEQGTPATNTEEDVDTRERRRQTLQEVYRVFSQLSPEDRERFDPTNPPSARRRGTRSGPRYNYEPHLAFIAEKIVEAECAGGDLSERKAAELASRWADEQEGLASVSFETLRGYFRKVREQYLAQARQRLHREQLADKARPENRQRETPVRSRRGSASAARSPRSVAHWGSLDSGTLASLCKPDVFDEVSKLIADIAHPLPDVLRAGTIKEIGEITETVTIAEETGKVPGVEFFEQEQNLAKPVRTILDEMEEANERATPSSESIGLADAAKEFDDPFKRMKKIFESFKPPKSRWHD